MTRTASIFSLVLSVLLSTPLVFAAMSHAAPLIA